MSVEVVIVGAGVAGLAAGLTLQKAGCSFVLIEAMHRIGGRACTDADTFRTPVDLGCHWIHSPAHNPFMALGEQYGFRVRTTPQPAVLMDGNGRLDETETETMLAHIAHCFDTIRDVAFDALDRTVADLFAHTGRKKEFFDVAFTNKQGVWPAEASAQDFASYVWVGNDCPVIDGYGALVARHARQVPVNLNTRAESIAWGNGKPAAVRTNRGQIKASAVIVTVSTGVLQAEQIRFEPGLPDWKREAIAALPNGSCNKVTLSFRKQIFRGLESAVVLPILGKDEAMEIVVGYEREDLATVLYNGRQAQALSAHREAAMREHAIETLATLFGDEVRREYSGTCLIADWDTEPTIRGAYSYCMPGKQRARETLARPIASQLFFAGEAVSAKFSGDVHGAYLSGIQAARDAMAAVRKTHPPPRD